MRNILAIAGKEARIYLTTLTSYVLFAAFTAVTAFFFSMLVQEFQMRRYQYAQGNAVGLLERMNLTDLVVGPTLSYVATLFIFLLPILTMRLFAEERRTKTLELMMTVPLRPLELVLGKYLAAWSMMLIMVVLTLIFPIGLSLLASEDPNAIDWSTVAVGYGGMVLLGSAGVGVGLLASSVTESQLVAVIIGFAVLILLLVVGVAANTQSGMWRVVLEHLSMSHHMQSFARGLVRTPDVIYYGSLTFLSLFFCYRVIEAERWR